MDRLADECDRIDGVDVVDTPGAADVIHFNSLNPLGRLVHGKESLSRHVADLSRIVRSDDTAVVVTEHGVEEFSDVEATMYLESNDAVRQFADRFKRGVERIFSRYVDAIIAISSMDREYLLDAGFDSQQVHFVPHGVDEAFLNSPTTSRDGDFVFHVSKCSPHKNPSAVIETAKRLSRRMVIAGDGWTEHHGEVLDSIETVEVLGYVSKERLIELYSSAAAFYFPSTYEPFGLPILEALACGTPVVASEHSAARDFDTEGVQLVDPLDIGRHVELLGRLLDDDTDRDRRSAASRAFAREMTWERTANLTISIYKTVEKNRYD
ncbi:glycosyltransferase [Halococcoides cellulosivorans]|nr:glycosyltransferase [Halococcoides cellulosivorans]